MGELVYRWYVVLNVDISLYIYITSPALQAERNLLRFNNKLLE